MMITRTVYDSYNFLCDSVPFSFGLVAIHPNIFLWLFYFFDQGAFKCAARGDSNEHPQHKFS